MATGAPHPLLLACQRLASDPNGEDWIVELGQALREYGRDADVAKLSGTPDTVHIIKYNIEVDPADGKTVQSLGHALLSPEAASLLLDMQPDDMSVEEGDSAIRKLISLLGQGDYSASEHSTAQNRPTGADGSHGAPAAGSASPPESMTPSTVNRARKPIDPNDAKEAGLRLGVAESFMVKLFSVTILLAFVAYAGLRLWDMVEIHNLEKSGWKTTYRVFLLFAEGVVAFTSVQELLSRARRQRLETLGATASRPFVVDDVLTLLTVTDESKETIVESVTSHYNAARPRNLPFRLVLVGETRTDELAAAHSQLVSTFPNVLVFVKEELARQEYVINAGDAEVIAALNVVLEENMYLGQVLFYALDRLFLQYQHSISQAAITVMEASSVVDAENYYTYVINQLERPGFSCVSTPTLARNKGGTFDFLDVTGFRYERALLSPLGADHYYAINSRAFTARGYSMWRTLRRMELENIDSQFLNWMMYTMHIERRQATIASMTQHAPITSTLVQKHTPTALSQVLERQAESLDVARIFAREQAFLTWDLNKPLMAPHDSACGAVLMEIILMCVICITAVHDVAPWSTERLSVAIAFLVLYGSTMLFHLSTPFTAITHNMVGAVLRNRVLVSANVWLYFLNLSRFGVDRRGHFRAVGETTTADLVNYKDNQRKEKEAAKAKEAENAKKAKAAAEEAQQKKRDEKAKAAKEAKEKRDAVNALKGKEKAEAAAAEKARKERERLKRARRGPGAGIPIAEARERRSPEIEVVGSQAPPPPPPTRSQQRGYPIGEGFLTRSHEAVPETITEDSESMTGATGTSVVSRSAVALAPRPGTRNNTIPRFTVPKGKEYGRTGAGERHRRHKFVKILSIPITVGLLVVAAVGVWRSYDRVFGSLRPINYTGLEVLAARQWYISVGLFSILLALPALIYLSFNARASILFTNPVVASLVVLVSALCVLLPGALPFASNAILAQRNAVYDLGNLHASSMRFLAAHAAGPSIESLAPPFHEATDTNIRNARNDKSLAGGWYTGPGLAKFTYPQAIAATEIAFSLITHFSELNTMPSGTLEAGSGRTGAQDAYDVLMHVAEYLLACHDPATNSIVSHVYDELPTDAGGQWVKPASRQGPAEVKYVDAENPGVETFAAVTAAFASLSFGLQPFANTTDIVRQLKTRAAQTWELVMNAPDDGSYEAVHPEVKPFWPSDPNSLNDDKLLAASMMLFATGDPSYRNAVNGFYTRAQQERASRQALDDIRPGVDDHWWLCNVVLFHADSRNSRYAESLEAFVQAWTNLTITEPYNVATYNGLRMVEPEVWGRLDTDFVTPGPVPLNLRSMAYIVLHVAGKKEESQEDRDAACFALGQVRNILGLNVDKRSYVVGVAHDGAVSPQQPTDRLTGPSSISDPTANPEVLVGAVVNGPDVSGNYQDSRADAQFSGVSILNNSPLSMLLGGLKSRALTVEDCIGTGPREQLARSVAISRQAADLNTAT